MKKLFLNKQYGSITGLLGVISGTIGLIIFEYLGFKFLIPRFISGNDVFVQIILLSIPFIIFFAYFIGLIFIILVLQHNKKEVDNGRDLDISFAFLFFVALAVLSTDHFTARDRLEEKILIEQEVVQSFSDYYAIPDSIFKESRDANLLITLDKIENGAVLNRKLNSEHGKSNNLFFIKPDLSYEEVKPYAPAKEIDKFIQEEIIQKISNYDEIRGSYYSSLGDKYLDVTEYGNNKVLSIRGEKIRYIINPDLSYSRQSGLVR